MRSGEGAGQAATLSFLAPVPCRVGHEGTAERKRHNPVAAADWRFGALPAYAGHGSGAGVAWMEWNWHVRPRSLPLIQSEDLPPSGRRAQNLMMMIGFLQDVGGGRTNPMRDLVSVSET